MERRGEMCGKSGRRWLFYQAANRALRVRPRPNRGAQMWALVPQGGSAPQPAISLAGRNGEPDRESAICRWASPWVSHRDRVRG